MKKFEFFRFTSSLVKILYNFLKINSHSSSGSYTSCVNRHTALEEIIFPYFSNSFIVLTILKISKKTHESVELDEEQCSWRNQDVQEVYRHMHAILHSKHRRNDPQSRRWCSCRVETSRISKDSGNINLEKIYRNFKK